MRNSINLSLLLLITLPLSSALPCFPGTFTRSREAACKPCPKGTFQSLTTLLPTPCRKCPPGTYLPFRRARGADLCMRCPQNTFSTARGATAKRVCKPCPTGTVSAPGSGACHTPCNPCQVLRSDGCKDCEGSERNDGNGFCQSETLPNAACANGQLEICLPGSEPEAFFFRRGACRECARKSISPKGEECQECPSGLVRNEARTECIPCPAGTAPNSSGACRACPSGQNTEGSRPLCVADGTPCPSNFFIDSSGNCNTCFPGERFDAENSKCVKCAENESSPGGISSRCRKCGRNEVGPLICECREGFVRNKRNVCVTCPAGTIAKRTGCFDCPVGFSSKPGSSRCEVCPPGTVKPERGRGSCLKCKNGLIASVLLQDEYPTVQFASLPNRELGFFVFDPIARSDCVKPKTNCPPHLRRAADGRGKFFCEAKSCPSGSLMTLIRPRGSFNGEVRACVSCAPGTILQGRICSGCRGKEISAGGLATKCVRCPRLEQRIDGKCFCDNFFSVGASLNATGACKPCPRGTATGLLTREQGCAECPEGSIASTFGNRDCQVCQKGTVEVDRKRCEDCPTGFTSFGVGDTSCVKIGGSGSA